MSWAQCCHITTCAASTLPVIWFTGRYWPGKEPFVPDTVSVAGMARSYKMPVAWADVSDDRGRPTT